MTNTILVWDGSVWVQASLPVKFGGLGIRSAVSVAPSAFMASSRSTAELVEATLPLCSNALPALHLEEAQLLWSSGHSHQVQENDSACRQKCWDNVTSLATATHLLDEAENNEECARQLVVSARKSGAWLRAVPVSALSLHMDTSGKKFP